MKKFYEICSKIYNYLYKTFEGTHKLEVIRKCGDYLQFFGVFTFIIYSIFCFNAQLVLSFILFYILINVICSILKIIFDNQRPTEYTDKVDENVKNPNLKLHFSIRKGNSFPSGHTASAMSAIWLFQLNPYLGILGILVALFVAFSRVAGRNHWLRDVSFSMVYVTILYFIIF